MSATSSTGIVTRRCDYVEYGTETRTRTRCETDVKVVASAPYAYCRQHYRELRGYT